MPGGAPVCAGHRAREALDLVRRPQRAGGDEPEHERAPAPRTSEGGEEHECGDGVDDRRDTEAQLREEVDGQRRVGADDEVRYEELVHRPHPDDDRRGEERRRDDRQGDGAERAGLAGAQVACGLLHATVEALEPRVHDQQHEREREPDVRQDRGPEPGSMPNAPSVVRIATPTTTPGTMSGVPVSPSTSALQSEPAGGRARTPAGVPSGSATATHTAATSTLVPIALVKPAASKTRLYQSKRERPDRERRRVRERHEDDDGERRVEHDARRRPRAGAIPAAGPRRPAPCGGAPLPAPPRSSSRRSPRHQQPAGDGGRAR